MNMQEISVDFANVYQQRFKEFSSHVSRELS